MQKSCCSPPQERTVAHASGSERSVLIPCHSVANHLLVLNSVALFLLILPSVFFRVIPWQIFCFCLFLPFLPWQMLLRFLLSVFFRVHPWQIFCFCLVFLPWLCFCLFFFPCFSVSFRGKSSASAWSSFRGKCLILLLILHSVVNLFLVLPFYLYFRHSELKIV